MVLTEGVVGTWVLDEIRMYFDDLADWVGIVGGRQLHAARQED